MAITLAFDIYGTLIDTQGVADQLSELIGDKAVAFAQKWREKQLEYSFRRGLMRCYVNFETCTRQALDYTDQLFATNLNEHDKQRVMNTYKVLPAFSDVIQGLKSAKLSGFRLYAFSNGSADVVKGLLQQADILNYFEDVISVDGLNTFKPNPDVYHHFLQASDSQPSDSWLISSNPFDVTGAVNAGMNAAWVQRSPNTPFDPWEINPTLILNSLSQLPEIIHL